MSGHVSGDRPIITPHGKTEHRNETSLMGGTKKVKVLKLESSFHKFSGSPLTTLKTHVDSVWNKILGSGVEISFKTEDKDKVVSKVRVSYGEIARFLGKSVFAVRLEVWRKNNIEQLVHKKVADIEQANLAALGPHNFIRYIKHLIKDKNGDVKAVAFLNSLETSKTPLTPQQLTEALKKHLSPKDLENLVKTAQSPRSTPSPYLAHLLATTLPAPELAEYIATLARRYTPSNTVAFLNSLETSKTPLTPQQLTEALLNVHLSSDNLKDLVNLVKTAQSSRSTPSPYLAHLLATTLPAPELAEYIATLTRHDTLPNTIDFLHTLKLIPGTKAEEVMQELRNNVPEGTFQTLKRSLS